jgi:serine/threonine protein kinase
LSPGPESVTCVKPREPLPSESTLSYRPRPAGEDSSAAPAAPRIASDAYLIREVIGTGGYGVVHAAVQKTLSREVAVKTLRREFYESKNGLPADTGWLERLFRQEAVMTGLLEHPNIVPIHDFGSDNDGHPLLALKLVRGKTWDTLMNEDYALPMPDFLARHLPILIDVAQATAFAHSRGIVHRDLKPHQVMVGEFGEALLMDWGLAAVYDTEKVGTLLQNSSDLHTVPVVGKAESPAGSPSFMAPEQTETTSDNVGPWTDVFLLGGILYTILTAVPPHRMSDAKGANEMINVARRCEIVPPESRVPDGDIPPELSDLCMRAMARLPEDRVASATAFIRELQDFLSGAGKRRESALIADSVAEKMTATIATYSELSALDAQLERALALWPGNPMALKLRQAILLRYANLAVENDDLTLARVQADRLLASSERDELLQEISILEQLNVREEAEAEEAELNRRKITADIQELKRQLNSAKKLLNDAQAALAEGSGANDAAAAVAREISSFLQQKA